MKNIKALRHKKLHGPMEYKEERAAYVFLLPWLIGLCIFTLYPMIISVYYAFCNYQLGTKAVFILFKNFIDMFSDANFFISLRVTFTYVFLGVPLQLIIALIIALLLNKGVPWLPIFRAIYYLPSLLGGSVAIAILWRFMFGAEGVLNQILYKLGIISILPGYAFSTAPDTSLLFLVILLAWQFGSPMIIFLAGLKQVPIELYESASIDGAGSWHKFTKITLPMLSHIILFNLIMQIISAFQAFTPAYVVGGNNGGVLKSLHFYTLYLYKVAFSQMRMGYASALAWFLLIIISAFTFLLMTTSKIWVYYDE